jgi:hypothetical protein
MSSKSDLIEQLNPLLFWDVSISSLDPVRSPKLIIERVFTLGSVEEIKLVLKFYGKSPVINILTSLNFLDPKTLNFASVFLKVPKKKFKCYTRKPSRPVPWP